MASPPLSHAALLSDRIAAIALSQDFQSSVLSGILLAIVAVAFRAFSPRARLLWSVSHQFAFNVGGQQPAIVYTRTLFIQNVGRAAAEQVEVLLNYAPGHLQLWPAFAYSTATTPDNHHVLTVPNLGPKEQFSIEMLQVSGAPTPLDMPNVLRVRSKAGEAKTVAMQPVRMYSGAAYAAMYIAFLFGVFELLRFALKGLFQLF